MFSPQRNTKFQSLEEHGQDAHTTWHGRPARDFKQPIEGAQVGKIDVMDFMAYVAVQRAAATNAEQKLTGSKFKGRSFKIKKL